MYRIVTMVCPKCVSMGMKVLAKICNHDNFQSTVN